jgi:hypothetical protein
VRRGAFLGYRWVLLAFLLIGVVQIFLAGLGVFRLQGQGLAAGGDTAFAPHRALGFTMADVAVVILVLALMARPGPRVLILSAVLVLLTSLIQACSRGSRTTTPPTAVCTPSTGCSSWASRATSMSGRGGASEAVRIMAARGLRP